MHLVIDIGNSFHKYAVFHDGEMIMHERVHSLSSEHIRSIIHTYPVSAAIVSSVAKQHDELKHELGIIPLILLDAFTPIPIKNTYSTPETLGNDRLASVVGASATFPGHNTLVIDAGTCIKYDFISAAAEYHGGAISPGLHMRFQAMHNYTARLPLITPEQLERTGDLPIRGDSTVNSLIAGGAKGAILEAESFIREYESSYPEIRVVLTGGDAPFFELHLKRKIFALPELVLFGLNIILEHNLKQT